MIGKITEKKILTVAVLMLVLLFTSCGVEAQRDKIGDYFYQKGGVYFLQSNYENAERSYKIAIYMQPKNFVYYGGLGAVYKDTNNSSEYENVQSAAGTKGIYTGTLKKWVKVHQNMVEYNAVCVSEQDDVCYFYDTENRLIRTDEYKDSISGVISLAGYSIYSYDENNQLIMKSDYNGENEQKSVTEYAYDENGQQISETKNNGKQKFYYYYQDGQLVKTEEYKKVYKDYDAALQEVNYYENGRLIKKEVHHSINGRLTYIYYYDNDIKYMEESYSKGENGVYRSSATKYTPEGKIQEELYYNEDETVRLRRIKIGEQGENVRIEETYNFLGNVTYRDTYILSEEGFCAGHEYEYFDKRGQLMYSLREYPIGTYKLVSMQLVDMTGARQLTEQEIDAVNRQLRIGKYGGTHFLDNVRFGYGAPENINIDTLVTNIKEQYGEKDLLTYKDEREIEDLRAEGVKLDYDNVELSTGAYYRVPYSVVNSLLEKAVGKSIKQLGLESDLYSEKYGCYYSYIDRAEKTEEKTDSYQCTGGEINNKWLQLYSDNNTWIFSIEGDKYYSYAFIAETHEDKTKPIATPTPVPTMTPQPEKTQVQYKIKDVFLYPVPGKSEQYNNAITAFNGVLKEWFEKVKTYDQEISADDLYNTGYSLFDMTGDGLPELVIRDAPAFLGYDIYMYVNGEAKYIDNIGHYGGDGGVLILANGIGYGQMNKTDRQWKDYYIFHSDGTMEKVTYGTEWDYYNEENKYQINWETVTREEYEQFIRPYVETQKEMANLEDLPFVEIVQ